MKQEYIIKDLSSNKYFYGFGSVGNEWVNISMGFGCKTFENKSQATRIINELPKGIYEIVEVYINT